MDFSAALFVRGVCGEGVWRKQLDQGRPALPAASAMARSAWLLLEELLKAGLPRVRRHRQRCCVSSSESRWNPSDHFWSWLQTPPSSCWAWTKPRLSSPYGVLEASLSPVPLPFRMLLKSILSASVSEQTRIPQCTWVLACLAHAARLSPLCRRLCLLLCHSPLASVRAPLSTLT